MTVATRSTRRTRRAVLVACATLAVSLGAAACGGGDDGDEASSTSSTSTSSTTSTTAATTTTQASSGGSSSSGGGSQSGGGNTSPAPTITSFTTPGDIDCHNGDFQMFTASWSTANATKVTISIDGPGVYKTYGPSGSDSLPFNCSSSHTFLLTAYGADGRTVTQSITLQPRNVQPATTSTSEP